MSRADNKRARRQAKMHIQRTLADQAEESLEAQRELRQIEEDLGLESVWDDDISFLFNQDKKA